MGGAQQGDQRAEQAAHHEHPLVALVGGHPEKGVHPADGEGKSIDDDIGEQGSQNQRLQRPSALERHGHYDDDWKQRPYPIIHNNGTSVCPPVYEHGCKKGVRLR